jgi:putative tryptophan/tyrosine transport system substrate-binding protein
MRRRAILVGIAATMASGTRVARAQQRDGMRRLGVLMGTLANDPEAQPRAAALVQGLGALNWHEGSNLRVDWRWAGGDPALFERYAGELVALGADVLLAGASSTAVAALRRQTSTLPIVFANVGDPVGQGFVASLARPGSNITGFSSFDPPMAGKWLGMLTQIVPRVARAAVLYNPATAPYAGLYLRGIEEAALSLAVAVQAAPVSDDAGVAVMMAALAHEERGGVLVVPSAFTLVHRDAIVILAARNRLPAVYPYRLFAAVGGLMSYGFDQDDQFRRAAAYVDRILKGEKPADLPVQRPDKFELAINLKTAKTLGVTVTPSLLATADEVIE